MASKAAASSAAAEFEGTGIDHGTPPPPVNVPVYGFVLWIATVVTLGACQPLHCRIGISNCSCQALNLILVLSPCSRS